MTAWKARYTVTACEMSPSDLLKAPASVGMAGTNMLELNPINRSHSLDRRRQCAYDIVVQIAERPARTTILHLVLCENAEYGTASTCTGPGTLSGITFASTMARSSERPSDRESPEARRTDGADAARVVEEEP